MSKYADIAQSIRAAIKAGAYKPGAALPEQKKDGRRISYQPHDPTKGP